MFGVREYIQENYAGTLFSEMLYKQGVVTGAGNVDCIKNYGDFGAKAIIISSLIISTPDDAAAVGTFTDATGRVLFQMDVLRSWCGIFEFRKVIDGPELFIRCDNVLVKFSVAHQYLTAKEA